ncbi:hypothetical protein [Nocardioides sp. WS12]|uniref:hypothetical protein n=1 Tax=Nocardioides sp. WS12 TaxID=2486272 RepID=UPI0015FDE432|nr:hypothetical protein [Nocardioides sp. WS12]
MIAGHSGPDAPRVSLFDGVEDASATLCALLVLPLIAVGGIAFGGAAMVAARVLGLAI